MKKLSISRFWNVPLNSRWLLKTGSNKKQNCNLHFGNNLFSFSALCFFRGQHFVLYCICIELQQMALSTFFSILSTILILSMSKKTITKSLIQYDSVSVAEMLITLEFNRETWFICLRATTLWCLLIDTHRWARRLIYSLIFCGRNKDLRMVELWGCSKLTSLLVCGP